MTAIISNATETTHAPGKVANGKINYDEFTSPEHTSWKTHRNLTTVIDEDEAGYRGCLGLALLINAVNCDSWTQVPKGQGDPLTFVPNNTVSWASLTDVPIGYFRIGAKKREVHWGTVRPTSLRFGMPMLARGTETHQFDFRAFPFDRAKVSAVGGKTLHVSPPPDTLNPTDHPRLFRVFNALEWAMTTTAFAFRKNWQPQRDKLAEALGYSYDPRQKLLAFGGGIYGGVARPYQWMPKAYIAFPESIRDAVYDRSTRAIGSPDMMPIYSEGLREAFVNDMGQYLAYRAPFAGRVANVDRVFYRGIPVLSFLLKGDRGERQVVRFFRDTCHVRKGLRTKFEAGDVIAEEQFDAALPDNWYALSPKARWDKWTWSLVPHRLDAVCRLWFERCGLSLKDGLVHFPAQIASLAALSSAVDGDLFWEVSNCLEYYTEDCDAVVFPTIQIRNWYDMTGALPGDVFYDVRPNDPRFETYQDQVKRVAGKRRPAKK